MTKSRNDFAIFRNTDAADAMIPCNHHNLLGQGYHHRLSGNLEAALNICQDLLSVDPQNAGASHLLGLIALDLGNLEQSLSCLSRAVRLNPQSSAYHCSYGNALRRQGRLTEAKRYLVEGVRLNPKSARGHMDLGIACQQMGSVDEALVCYRQSLVIDAGNADAYNNLGLIYQQKGDKQKALECFEHAAGRKADHTCAHMNMGHIHQANGDFQHAIACYRRALRTDPGLVNAYLNIGRIYQSRKAFQKALEWYNRALAIDPGNATIITSIGAVNHEMNNLALALQNYQAAIEVDPNRPHGYFNAGNICRDLGQYDKAVGFYRQALAADSTYRPALVQLLNQLYRQFDWEAINGLEQTLHEQTQQALSRSEKTAQTPFMNLSRYPDPAYNYAVARSWSREIELAQAEPSFPRSAHIGREKIRVGYLSGNFRNHPSAHLVEGLLRGHDRNRFSITCYAYGKNDGSTERKRIQENCDFFREIADLDDIRAASQIHKDGIDVLIDLMGFTQGARLKICAYRPAPIQVRYLGQAGTTGARFFDYLVADAVVAPADDARYYSEALVVMPHCYQVNNYRDGGILTEVSEKKTIPATPFVYCSFCSVYKIEPFVFDTWMRILRDVPQSVLWLIDDNPGFVSNITQAAKAAGVDSERIVFQPKLPRNDHLLRLSNADLALDTWVVNGAATTTDALWAGLPVVTRKGTHFASRMSSSMLKAIGMNELIASDTEDYANLAIALGQAPSRVRQLRKKILDSRCKEPLFDTDRFIRNLEKAYVKMLDRYRLGKKPARIQIKEDN